MHKLLKTMAVTLSAAGMASALPFSFLYEGNSYGTMNLTVADASTVEVDFTSAGSIPGLSTFQVTGFAFAVNDDLTLSIVNPADAAFTYDDNGLNWITLTNLNAIPTATNSGIQKDIWDFGVTEGNATNLTPPGILPGGRDVFYLTGFSGLVDDASIASNIALEGIRIQAIGYAPGSVGGAGSLFLTSTPLNNVEAVPEPTTMALFGLGILGIGFAARRKRK